MEEKVHTGLTYGVEDKPDLGTTIVLGFQNVITAFGGLVAVPLISTAYHCRNRRLRG